MDIKSHNIPERNEGREPIGHVDWARARFRHSFWSHTRSCILMKFLAQHPTPHWNQYTMIAECLDNPVSDNWVPNNWVSDNWVTDNWVLAVPYLIIEWLQTDSDHWVSDIWVPYSWVLTSECLIFEWLTQVECSQVSDWEWELRLNWAHLKTTIKTLSCWAIW